MKKFPITVEGYQALKADIQKLKYKSRPEVIKEISIAREFGDLSENAEYQAAKEKQRFIENKLLDLQNKLSRAEIIDTSKLSNNNVKFGAVVNLINNKTKKNISYNIVGEYEADLKKNKISATSPLAKALIGKEVNETVEFISPKYKRSYTIIKISFN